MSWIPGTLMTGLFLVLGIVFRSGRGSFLIAGYNTMPKDRRAQYDKDALCRSLSRLMFACAVAVGFSFFGEFAGLAWAPAVGGVSICVLAVVFVVYANTGNRFKK